jgi:hypothetical protein
LLPHWQTPDDEQLSDIVGSQVVQELPVIPHAVMPGVVHTLPAQQPLVHDTLSQTQLPW